MQGSPNFGPSPVSGGGGGGGYNAGITPIVVQNATNSSSTGSVVMGTAPVSGNLLVAICCGINSVGAGTGWTIIGSNTSGTDDMFVLTKLAGAGESATQTPVNTDPNGGITVWEISGQASSNYVAALVMEAEQTGNIYYVSPTVVNVKTMIALSAAFVVPGGTIVKALNVGTVDALANTGTRYVAVGHGTLTDTPLGGISVLLTTASNVKASTVQITT